MYFCLHCGQCLSQRLKSVSERLLRAGEHVFMIDRRCGACSMRHVQGASYCVDCGAGVDVALTEQTE